MFRTTNGGTTWHELPELRTCHGEKWLPGAGGMGLHTILLDGKAIKAAGHPALYMVDTVASLGCMPFEMDAWGVDVTVGGSQKGLMLPTGMSITGVSPKAMEAYAGAVNQLALYPDSRTTILREAIAADYRLEPERHLMQEVERLLGRQEAGTDAVTQ